jgi:hypothetical protein
VVNPTDSGAAGATEKQIGFLRWKGVAVWPGITKGEATELITQVRAGARVA